MRGRSPTVATTGWAALLLALAGAAGARAEPAEAEAEGEGKTPVQAPRPGDVAGEVASTTDDDRRPYRITGLAQFRTLAIRDEDPRNDQVTIYRLRGQGTLFEGASAYVRFGLLQRFVAEPDESGFLLQDTLAGVSYTHAVDLGPRDLDLTHNLAVFLPTSRASQTQDLYAAPLYELSASIEAVDGLVLHVEPGVQYRFHEYAERAGLQGGMNTQLRWEVRGGVDYTLFDSETAGMLAIGGSSGSTWDLKYASRDDHESASSDRQVLLQSYDWEGHVVYRPLSFLRATVSIEHGGRVLRDGIVNTFFVHRDETELAFTLSGHY